MTVRVNPVSRGGPPERIPPKSFDALVLTGGGITGAVYHLAVLAALEDAAEGFDANAFPAYLGSSSGATVCALLAGGLPARRLHLGFAAGDGTFPVRHEHFFPRGRMYLLRSLLKLATRYVAEVLRSRSGGTGAGPPVPVETLAPGLFSTDSYERFLEEYLRQRGVPTRFAAFPRRLLIPGFDLDSARRVVFGRGSWCEVPVPRAVAASSAIPLIYRPVEIGGHWIVDGDTGGNNHLDVLLAEGCRRFLVVNPVVPLVNPLPARLHERGMLAVWSQAARMQNRNQFSASLRRQFAAFPDMEVTLIEPPPGDAEMFAVHSMNLGLAPAVAGYAHASTLRRLREGGWEAFDARGGALGRRDEEDLERDPAA